MSASGKPGTIGAPPGSPFIAANPLAASTSVPKPGRCAAGPGLPPSGDADQNQARVPRAAAHPSPSPMPLERAGHERLEHDVESRQQPQQQRRALRGDFRFSVM